MASVGSSSHMRGRTSLCAAHALLPLLPAASLPTSGSFHHRSPKLRVPALVDTMTVAQVALVVAEVEASLQAQVLLIKVVLVVQVLMGHHNEAVVVAVLIRLALLVR